MIFCNKELDSEYMLIKFKFIESSNIIFNFSIFFISLIIENFWLFLDIIFIISFKIIFGDILLYSKIFCISLIFNLSCLKYVKSFFNIFFFSLFS